MEMMVVEGLKGKKSEESEDGVTLVSISQMT